MVNPTPERDPRLSALKTAEQDPQTPVPCLEIDDISLGARLAAQDTRTRRGDYG